MMSALLDGLTGLNRDFAIGQPEALATTSPHAGDHPMLGPAPNRVMCQAVKVEAGIEHVVQMGEGIQDHRPRGRLLVDLSAAALAGADHIDSRPEPAAANSLIDSESVRELSFDRVSFAHDVLREWGVAALLHTHVEKLDGLPLVRPASMSLARGVELGARLVLERPSDAQGWIGYINRVSQAEAHASWRRFSMLGILRSELSSTLRPRRTCAV